jgi:hypothetical protein
MSKSKNPGSTKRLRGSLLDLPFTSYDPREANPPSRRYGAAGGFPYKSSGGGMADTYV